ncbi:MAG: hypothetical protein QOJ42_4142 [Acidobacteriaceae bacterium]|nr:hypothetical protein [Acidobacteriaceae bacterium]
MVMTRTIGCKLSASSSRLRVRRTEKLTVLAVSEVGWSDWGAPQRVQSTLARMGILGEGLRD